MRTLGHVKQFFHVYYRTVKIKRMCVTNVVVKTEVKKKQRQPAFSLRIDLQLNFITFYGIYDLKRQD